MLRCDSDDVQRLALLRAGKRDFAGQVIAPDEPHSLYPNLGANDATIRYWSCYCLWTSILLREFYLRPYQQTLSSVIVGNNLYVWHVESVIFVGSLRRRSVCLIWMQCRWSLMFGPGIRFAEELGVHRRQPEGYKWTSLDEQKRRAFWVLVSLDRLTSGFFGRPSAIRDEEWARFTTQMTRMLILFLSSFDCDLPLECDDEYWENPQYPESSFKQPADKPSIISCFNSHLRLCEILAFALRTLYSTKKSKLLLGLVGEEWEQKILRELGESFRFSN